MRVMVASRPPIIDLRGGAVLDLDLPSALLLSDARGVTLRPWPVEGRVAPRRCGASRSHGTSEAPSMTRIAAVLATLLACSTASARQTLREQVPEAVEI